MHRTIALLLPLLVLLVLTWGHEPSPPPATDLRVRFVRLALPPREKLAPYLGPFRLEAGWRIESGHYLASGFSSMVPQPDGRILAFSDAGGYMRFSPPPGAGERAPQVGWINFRPKRPAPLYRDVESVAHDPATGRYWLGIEGRNEIVRTDAKLVKTDQVAPAALAEWGKNSGSEAMLRLGDGRFVVIRETTLSFLDSRLHEAVLFAGDPIAHPDGRKFLFEAPDNFSVVDMALLPDGRALILMRRLLWPLPMRFAGRIAVADPARIRPGQVWRSTPVASLASILPIDNFEAIGVEAGPAGSETTGRVTVWLMSDDNHMRVLQRTLLWKLSVDPRQLP